MSKMIFGLRQCIQLQIFFTLRPYIYSITVLYLAIPQMEVAIGIESLIFSSIIIGNISEFCLFISISCSRDLTVLLFHLSSCLREIPCHEVQTPGYYRKSLSMKNTPRGKKCSLRPCRYRPFNSTIELLWTLQCVVRAILLVFTTVRLGQSRVSVIFSR